jgi:predicted DNA binding protein
MSLSEPYHITIEVVNQKCKGLRILESLGIDQYTLKDVRGLPEGPTRHLIKIPKEQIKRVPKDKFTKINSNGEAWFDSDGCDVCNTILSNMSFLVSARHISGYTIIYDFVVPNYEAFQRILATLEDKGLSPNIIEVTQFKSKMKVLTEKQERTLWLALKFGFFEYPRKINSIELSKKLGVVTSTFSETTRRGIRRILKHYFEV